ncbi:eukaryotic aspartyl protease [Colletotrichum gloeosporioides Cg-14]|uniref:Eukaryotic aspartyl protease n=1 Tax=Colletotrichum gloeosporioides (strain Cg-14) TaxID=1237896 RepID=T0JVQ5_COLGC|nr:eukaryotic aspartyl protease [Colletotrichum gloeosporioides Cg-14]
MWFDTVKFQLEADSSGPNFMDINTTIQEVSELEETYTDLLSVGEYMPIPVGILGLGQKINFDSEAERKKLGFPLWIIDQFVESNTITANSWFLHLGDNRAEQTCSFSLGGYEKNRVLGRVGTFDLDSLFGMPKAFLIDVAVGVEYGGSPFLSDRTLGSVWDADNITVSDKELVKQYGGPSDSLMVLPDAAFPYICLPRRVCDAAAEYLPVYYDAALGLYVWNTADELDQVNRIINAPAYMSFTFSDMSAENITIKVPFASLFLEVTPQRNGSAEDARYWPCKPWADPYSEEDDPNPGPALIPFHFGRAFLQAAFTGYNYDRKRFYMGQAPGPDAGQRVLVDDDADNISSNPADSFAASWQRLWTAIELNNSTNATSDDQEANGSKSAGDGTTAGRTAGIVVGAVAGICGAIGGGWWYFGRRRRQDNGRNAATHSGDEYHAIGGKPELDGEGIPIAELHPETAKRESQVLAELHSPSHRNELEVESMVYEMPAGDVSPSPREQPASHEKGDQSPQKP